MRTLLAIPLMLLIPFSGISLKYAAHYCRGNQVATKISLTGELASCGMEQSPEPSVHGMIIKTKCCDNVTTSYSFNGNYIPTYHNTLRQLNNLTAKISFAVTGMPVAYIPIIHDTINISKPPGFNYPDLMDRSRLCILRI